MPSDSIYVWMTKALRAEKENPDLDYVSIWVVVNVHLLKAEGQSYLWPTSSDWFVSGAISGSPAVLSVASKVGARHCQQLQQSSWKGTHAEPQIIWNLATMAFLFMGPLHWSDREDRLADIPRKGSAVPLAGWWEALLQYRCSLVGIKLRHKDLHRDAWGSSPYVQSHSPSLDLMVTDLPVLLFSGPWPPLTYCIAVAPMAPKPFVPV